MGPEELYVSTVLIPCFYAICVAIHTSVTRYRMPPNGSTEHKAGKSSPHQSARELRASYSSTTVASLIPGDTSDVKNAVMFRVRPGKEQGQALTLEMHLN